MALRYWVGGGATAAFNATGPTNWGSASGVRDNASVPGSSDDAIFDGSVNGATNCTFSAGANVKSIDFTGWANTFTHAAATDLTISGAGGVFKLSTGMTYTLGNAATSRVLFTATSGTTAITTNGKTMGNVTLNGTGGTFQFQDNFTSGSTATLNLNAGTLDSNGKDFNIGIFLSANSGVRVMSATSGTWTITGNAGTIFSTSTANVTWNFTAAVVLNYSGSTGTRTVTLNSFSVGNLSITGGTDTVTLNSTACIDLNWTGFAGTYTSSALTVAGNLTFATGMTVSSGTSAITMTATSAKDITFNGVQVNRGFTFNGVGGVWTLKDNMDLTGASQRTITITNGTLTAVDGGSNRTISAAAVSVAAGGTFTLGSATHTFNGTGSVWTVNSSATINAGTSTIKFTDTSNTANTFDGGGKTYSTVWFARGTSTQSNTIVGNNTFAVFKDDGSVAHSLLITAGSVQTILTASGWQVSGNASQLITVDSPTAATHTISCASGAISADYLSIKNSIVSGGANAYAGANSSDQGGNVGWQFIARGVPGNSAMFAYAR